MNNISNETLWEIVNKIVEHQQIATFTDPCNEPFVDWKDVELGWFDYLKEKLEEDE